MINHDFDIVIVGAGMVGASMACSLDNSDYKIALIEAFDVNSHYQPSFDERTVALTYSSKRIFNAINVWHKIDQQSWPIESIQITNGSPLGFTSLGLQDVETPALGYVVPTKQIGRVLHEKIKSQKNINFFCPANVEEVNSNEQKASVTLNYNNKSVTLNTKLVIIADGGRSPLLESLDITLKKKAYDQCALVAIVATNKENKNTAYEHFTDDGPLALLPIREKDYALAWTLKKPLADQLLLSDADYFLNQLQTAFPYRAGKFIKVGKRNVYPLMNAILDKPTVKRMVILGNAAHTVHPVAGQGFNLGLRDVGYLYEILVNTKSKDPGDQTNLDQYSSLREKETKHVSWFTDSLIQTFTHSNVVMKHSRNLLLSLINILPPVKQQLLKRTMGLNARQSQLAMQGKQD